MSRYVIAVDIGGSGIKCAVVDQSGKLFAQASVEINASLGLEEIREKLYLLLDEKHKKYPDISVISIASLGAVDSVHGMIIGACENLPAIEGYTIKKDLKKRYQTEVLLMNDVNAAAIGEAYYGAGRDLDSFFCVALGTGIGGAFVFRRQIVAGKNGLCGEIGYLLQENGTNYEMRASAGALSARCESQGISKEIYYHCREMKKEMCSKQIFFEWLNELARGLCEVIYVLDPGTIIIGGAISGQGQILADEIQKRVDAFLNKGFRGNTRIVMAEHRNHANLMGAAANYFYESDTLDTDF